MAVLCFALNLAGSAVFLLMGLFFAALHELGHLAALALCGGRPSRICLTAAGVRIERAPGLALSFPQEICIAFAGPAASLLLAVLCALLHRAFPAILSPAPCLLNLGFGLFNLLPVRQLDGGQALFYALSRFLPAPEKLLRRVSFNCLFLAAFAAALLSFRNGINISLVIAIVYLAACV